MDRTIRRLMTLGLLLGAPLSLAQSSSAVQACWNRDVERIDYLQNPPEGGDNEFFTGVSDTSGNTNVTLVWPSHATLMDFTQRLYRIRVDLGGTTPTGCSNAYLNGLGYFLGTGVNPPAGPQALQGTYDPTKTYPDPGPTYSGGNGLSDGLSSGYAYRYRNWPTSSSTGGTSETYLAACTAAGGAAQQAACLACLNTRGYWLNPAVADKDITPSAAVFTTNWLRFHPVKWTLLALAYKRLVNGPLLLPLREAVLGQAGDKGTTLLQKMLPQSCAGQGRPLNQKISAIDGVTYTSTAYPLAEMLFNAAWYMGGQTSPWLFSNNGTFPSSFPNSKSGPCVNCRGDFIVLFGDGRGDTANAACAPVGGVTPAWCSAPAQCSTLGMGAEDDGDDFLDPSMAGGAGSAISGVGVRQAPAGTCDLDLADDVAGWMNVNPVGIGYPNSTLRTYVVAIGDPKNTYGEMTTLQQVAARGGGDYVVADDYATLESNIQDVFMAIVNRSTSFSAASITTVQSSGYTSAFLPRFTPNGGQLWPGTVTRFSLFNEFASGCTSADQGKVTSANPNGDTDCNDFYLTDANKDFVGESNGNFVVLDNSQRWDAGWPAKAGGSDGGVAAKPFWEAGQVLTARVNDWLSGNASRQRAIYTVAPDSSGGYDPTLIQFTSANADRLTPLFQLGGVNGDFCTTLGNLTRHTYVTESDCGRDLIDFVNGRDILLQNPANRTNPPPASYQARPNVLGDIFHSTPVLVTPPAPTFLCDLGVVNQCVPSLYDQRFEPGGQDAYNTYFSNNQYRSQFLLVGSNDGMLHAFNAGNDTVSGTTHSFDLGTGDEMWAFIPPDLLPKLIRLALGDRHELMVDGTPMVRDVWVDLNGDHMKTANEYRTVAVTGEREGGRAFFALDVTDPNNPKFLWDWPPPGTNDALVAGESWNDLGPAAPPIGPIAEADSQGLFKVQGAQAKERYVVAVGGGFDPAYLRGRAIWVLDVWSGQTVYRFAASDASGVGDLRSALYPVAAPPSLADTDADGIFDTLVVGDTGGQVWTVGMGSPGQPGSSSGYSNWFAARAFIQFKGQAFSKRSPIFQRAVLGLLPGNVWRFFLGSGDRDQIKDPNGGTCGLANLGACVRKGCSVTVNSSRYNIASGGTGHYESGSWSYSSGASQPTQSLGFDSPPDKQSMSCSDVVDSRIDTTISCGGAQTQYSAQAYCDWSPGVPGGVDCEVTSGRPMGTAVSYSPSSMEYSRFYSVRLFDTTRVQFTTAAGATAYDSAVLTDTNLVNASSGTAGSTSSGWYIAHANSIDERTASAAFMNDGCVIWSTLQPNPVQTMACNATLPLDTAYTYQADATGGGVQCGSSGGTTRVATARFVTRNTYVAPQQPALVLSVNATTGQVAYGGVLIEPGSGPLSSTTGVTDMMGTVHWLDVPPAVHDCRHDGNCSN